MKGKNSSFSINHRSEALTGEGGEGLNMVCINGSNNVTFSLVKCVHVFHIAYKVKANKSHNNKTIEVNLSGAAKLTYVFRFDLKIGIGFQEVIGYRGIIEGVDVTHFPL